jgi:hypothetical protein
MDEWPQGRAKSRGGRTVRWALVDMPAKAAIDLAWENILYSNALPIVQAWNDAYGRLGTVAPETIPVNGLYDLADLVIEPYPDAVWYIREPPTIEAVKRKRCTLRMGLWTRWSP